MGIAPLLSIIRHMRDLGRSHPRIIYSSQEGFLYQEELSGLFHDTSSQSRFNISYLELTEVNQVYLCGPPGFQQDMKDQLMSRGLTADQIITETWS